MKNNKWDKKAKRELFYSVGSMALTLALIIGMFIWLGKPKDEVEHIYLDETSTSTVVPSSPSSNEVPASTSSSSEYQTADDYESLPIGVIGGKINYQGVYTVMVKGHGWYTVPEDVFNRVNIGDDGSEILQNYSTTKLNENMG